MNKRGSLFAVFVVLIVLGGCAFDDLKYFAGKQEECLPPTILGRDLLWGYKFARTTTIPQGTFKFKFNLDPVTGGALPEEYGIIFYHRAPNGQILFSDAIGINTGEDGAIPFQTIQVNQITFKKNESLNLSFRSLDRNLPLTDLTFAWNYRALDQSRIPGIYSPHYPEPWYQLLPSKEVGRTTVPKNFSFSEKRVRVIP